MATKSSRKLKPSRKLDSWGAKIMKNPKVASSLGVVFADALLVGLIIAYAPYTKIDWDAYMSQVTGFLEGERDYRNLRGDTGPLVYPAGFLYGYSAIQYVTAGWVARSLQLRYIIMGRCNFYVVFVGRQVGIFTNWNEVKLVTEGFSDARFKRFWTLVEAENAYAMDRNRRSRPNEEIVPTATELSSIFTANN